jgi:hypothetical protein
MLYPREATLPRWVAEVFSRKPSMHPFTRSLSTLAAVLAVPLSSAHAQFVTLEKVFEKLTDVSVYAGRSFSGDAGRTGDRQLAQFGVELFIALGTISRPLKPESAASKTQRDTVSARTPRDSTPADTLLRTLTEVTRKSVGGVVEMTETYTVKRRPLTADTTVRFELGLGYGQISGVQQQTGPYTIRGTVRELPSVSLYTTFTHSGLYLGLRSGVIQATGLQIYDEAGVTKRAAPTAFQIGASLGWSPAFLGAFPFVEGGWMQRRFNSLDWNGDTVAVGIPRDINLSGWQVLAGVQIPLRAR